MAPWAVLVPMPRLLEKMSVAVLMVAALRVPVKKRFVVLRALLTKTFPWTNKFAPCAVPVPIPRLLDMKREDVLMVAVLRVPVTKRLFVLRALVIKAFP